MALLVRREPLIRVALCAHHLVGRGSNCHTVIGDRGVSGEHASVYWSDGAWWVRDLGSRNGTFVEGIRLAPGESARVRIGQALRFGSAKQMWVFEDESPPIPCAWPLVDGEPWGLPLQAADSLLQLPNDDEPEVMVYHNVDQGWLAEQDEKTRPVQDQEVLELHGKTWLLALPPGADDPVSSTVELSQSMASASRVGLVLEVSADQEYIQLVLHHGPVAKRLRTRSHNELIFLLAQARVRDRGMGIAPVESGWVYIDDLLHELRLDLKNLNMQVFRARKQLSLAGVDDAEQLIERRDTTRQMRLGNAHVLINNSPTGRLGD